MRKKDLDKIGELLENELKRNFTKNVSNGYYLALQTIVNLAQEKKEKNEDFDAVEYCKKELIKEKKMNDVLDVMYDKRKNKIEKENL